MLNPEDSDALGGFLARLADHGADMDTVFALRVAEAGLKALREASTPVPAIAVVGPTQTGKSTVVNILAGGEHVDTSPLAAHTQRAAVLAVGCATDMDRMPDFHAAGLPVEPRAVAGDGPLRLIWDTPDFDSNAAAVYRQQVARVCGLADRVVVVLSREKYADQSVWRVLETIAPLETPTMICLNKSDPGPDTGVLMQAIERRLAGNPLVADDIPVHPLPMLPPDGVHAALARPDVRTLRDAVLAGLERRPEVARRAGLARLIRHNWEAWVAPVEQELACRREWDELVAAQTRSFLERYRSEYIDHAKHHDVAQKAILGLLELLEIPALAGPITRTRRALTWPFRRLAASFGGAGDNARDKELEVLDAAIDHYLLSLRAGAASHRHPWWRALEAELEGCEASLKQAFRASIDRYREAFQPRIDDLSNELYQQLKRNPATLNALRATRIGADAGGIVIAFNTGALGLYDALFAPAVLSLTSYLTESAVGQYLRSVIGGLKREQYERVSAIIDEYVARPLAALEPEGPGLTGLGDADLARAREGLAELEP